MEVQTYSKAGGTPPNGAGLRQVGTTQTSSISKPGQRHTIYGATKENRSEVSAHMQAMLNDKKNPDLQDYARRVLNK